MMVCAVCHGEVDPIQTWLHKCPPSTVAEVVEQYPWLHGLVGAVDVENHMLTCVHGGELMSCLICDPVARQRFEELHHKAIYNSGG